MNLLRSLPCLSKVGLAVLLVTMGCKPKAESDGELKELQAKKYAFKNEASYPYLPNHILFNDPIFKAFDKVHLAYLYDCITQHKYEQIETLKSSCFPPEDLNPSIGPFEPERYGPLQHKATGIKDPYSCVRFVGYFNSSEKNLDKCIINKKKSEFYSKIKSLPAKVSKDIENLQKEFQEDLQEGLKKFTQFSSSLPNSRPSPEQEEKAKAALKEGELMAQ